MPLGMEVRLGPGHLVFDGDPAPPEKGAQSQPNFWPMSIVPKRLYGSWINVSLGTEVNLGPGDVVLDGVAASPKRHTAPGFRPMSIVAKRLGG